MSSSDDYTASDALEDGTEGVDERGVPGYAQAAVIGGILASLGYAISDLILSVQGTLFAPVRAFADGMATFIGGTLGAPILITDAGAETSASSFTSGTAALLGPAAFPVAVAVSVAGILVFLWFLSNNSITPWSILGDEDE
ncbi:hypothetical protein [Halobellus captivus]|uniref:hypothetical protein n=1 Tax=Halobellus captivus TaxID=2592614 RepID=UPI0011A551B6|nr:hypothetical protein [Halobellus captivus]